MVRNENDEVKTGGIGSFRLNSLLNFEIKADWEITEKHSFEYLDKRASESFSRQDYVTCLNYLNRALVLSSQIKGQIEGQINLVDLHFNISNVCFILKKYKQAEENFINGLAIEIKQLGRGHSKIADRYKEIANIFYSHNNKEKYFCYLAKRYEILSRNELKVSLFKAADYQVKLAKCYFSMDAVNSAIAAYQRALAIYLKCKDNSLGSRVINKVIKVLNKLGKIHFDLGNFAIALDYHQKALKLQTTIHFGEQSMDSAHTHYYMGLTYEKLGRINVAITSHKTAIAILNSFKNEKYAGRLEQYHVKLKALEQPQYRLFPTLSCCLSIFQRCKKNEVSAEEKLPMLRKD